MTSSVQKSSYPLSYVSPNKDNLYNQSYIPSTTLNNSQRYPIYNDNNLYMNINKRVSQFHDHHFIPQQYKTFQNFSFNQNLVTKTCVPQKYQENNIKMIPIINYGPAHHLYPQNRISQPLQITQRIILHQPQAFQQKNIEQQPILKKVTANPPSPPKNSFVQTVVGYPTNQRQSRTVPPQSVPKPVKTFCNPMILALLALLAFIGLLLAIFLSKGKQSTVLYPSTSINPQTNVTVAPIISNNSTNGSPITVPPLTTLPIQEIIPSKNVSNTISIAGPSLNSVQNKTSLSTHTGISSPSSTYQ